MGNGRISAKQSEILEYIKEEILNKGYPPAVREICNAVHLKSTSSRPFTPGNTGKEWIYSKRPYQTTCNRDRR